MESSSPLQLALVSDVAMGNRSSRNATCPNGQQTDLDEQIVDLTILTMAGTTVCNIQVPSSATVKTIKAAVATSTGDGTRISRQRLLLGTVVLSDEQKLVDLGTPPQLALVRLQWKSEQTTFAVGDLVQLHYDGDVIYESLDGTEQPWLDHMNDMLGRSFAVRSVPKEGFVGLPNPDPSQAGKDVVFPESVVRAGEELKSGDIVRMLPSEKAVKLSFETAHYIWHPLMRGMLGREFPILEMTSRGIIALPSPDGSQNGMWYFPNSCVSSVASDFEPVVRRQQDAPMVSAAEPVESDSSSDTIGS